MTHPTLRLAHVSVRKGALCAALLASVFAISSSVREHGEPAPDRGAPPPDAKLTTASADDVVAALASQKDPVETAPPRLEDASTVSPEAVTRPPEQVNAIPEAKGADEVVTYLWSVYQRSGIKLDSRGDFTWKDVAASARLGLAMRDYVIGGMDRDFRELLYHAGHAMDAAGIEWTILSAFRDDYRQSLAVGLKAHDNNSFHGGSLATGGYGHGCAVDLASVEGGNANNTVWNWLELHAEQFGLFRPLRVIDPAHVQARGGWRERAGVLRTGRAGQEPAAPEDVAGTGVEEAALGAPAGREDISAEQYNCVRPRPVEDANAARARPVALASAVTLRRVALRASLNRTPTEKAERHAAWKGHGEAHVAKGRDGGKGKDVHLAKGGDTHGGKGKDAHVAKGADPHAGKGKDAHVAKGGEAHPGKGKDDHVASRKDATNRSGGKSSGGGGKKGSHTAAVGTDRQFRVVVAVGRQGAVSVRLV